MIREYRKREYVHAERVEFDMRVVSSTGNVSVKAGDYLVYGNGGLKKVRGEDFEAEYELVPEEVSEAHKFTPAGKTVEQVLEFLAENPDETERVKLLEKGGAARKGIMEFVGK